MIIIEIAGHLGADPESRFTPNGQKVTTLRVATNVRKGGKDETVWWRVTIWGDRFDKMIAYLKKGSAVIVIGEMGKPEIYTDREGRQQISLELTAEMLRFSPFGKPENKSNQEHSQNAAGGARGSHANAQHTEALAGTASGTHGGFSAGGNTAHADDNDEPMPF